MVEKVSLMERHGVDIKMEREAFLPAALRRHACWREKEDEEETRKSH